MLLEKTGIVSDIYIHVGRAQWSLSVGHWKSLRLVVCTRGETIFPFANFAGHSIIVDINKLELGRHVSQNREMLQEVSTTC